jgi:hypothetical protein
MRAGSWRRIKKGHCYERKLEEKVVKLKSLSIRLCIESDT